MTLFLKFHFSSAPNVVWQIGEIQMLFYQNCIWRWFSAFWSTLLRVWCAVMKVHMMARVLLVPLFVLLTSLPGKVTLFALFWRARILRCIWFDSVRKRDGRDALLRRQSKNNWERTPQWNGAYVNQTVTVIYAVESRQEGYLCSVSCSMDRKFKINLSVQKSRY